MAAVLSARNVTVTLGNSTILKDVTIEVAPGESLAVIGGSNSGKSTLLRVLAGLLSPTAGEVRLNGERVITRDRFAVPRPRGIGYVSQLLGLRSNMSVVDNVMLPLRYHGRASDEDARRLAESLLARLGVTEFAVRPASLAPGEAELVALARALASQPLVLLFDNPTAVVDVDSADRVVDILRDHRSRGLAVVSATSSEVVASVIASSVRRLREGRMEEP